MKEPRLTRTDRWMISIAFSVVLVALTAAVTTFLIETRPTPDVPLTAELSGGDWDAVSREFDRRIQAAFPIGSAESDMIAVLRAQDFVKEDWNSSFDAEHTAIRREHNIACNMLATVRWRTATDGKLTAIQGEYGEAGCL